MSRDAALAFTLVIVVPLLINSIQMNSVGLRNPVSFQSSTFSPVTLSDSSPIPQCYSPPTGLAAGSGVSPACGSGCNSNTVYIYVSQSDGLVGVGSQSYTYSNGAVLTEACYARLWIFAEPYAGWAFTGWQVSGPGGVVSSYAAFTQFNVGGQSGGVIYLTLTLSQNYVLPTGATIQGSTPEGVFQSNQQKTDSMSIPSGHDTTSQLLYWFGGPQNGAFDLNNLSPDYNGPVVPMTVLVQSTIQSDGGWYEDSGGVGDKNGGASMVVTGWLSTIGQSGITAENPGGAGSSNPWTIGSQGTVSASVGFQGGGVTAGVSYSYNVPKIQGQLFQTTYYQNYNFEQGWYGGGSPQSFENWAYGLSVLSAANAGWAWPKTSFVLTLQTTGNYWANCPLFPPCDGNNGGFDNNQIAFSINLSGSGA